MSAPSRLSTMELLEAAIEQLRALLVSGRTFEAADVELAAQAVARAFVHARRHLRILEQATRDLLAMAAIAAPATSSDSSGNGGQQRFLRVVDTEGRKDGEPR